MELFDEELELNKKNGNKTTTTIILVVIILLLILTATLAGIIIYLKQNTLTVTLNGATNSQVKSMLMIDENDNSKIYVPIKQIAASLGYEAFNGNYTTKSEDSSQCYVQCDEEVAMFKLNSNVLYKIVLSGDSEYEYYYLDEKVISSNGELYTTIDGIEKAFNVLFNYDVEKKSISIYTMPYLIEYYSANIMNYGYSAVSEDFINQKAVLDDMLIVTKGEDGSSQKVGVLNLGTMDPILETKYDDIKYLQRTSSFLVTAGDKMGIINKNRNTKVPIEYDNIKVMDYDEGLYCVEQEGRYGIINFNGDIVANLDYEEIGIDNSKFKQNDIKNGYIIADSLIPVKQNDLWGFLNTSGEQVTECKYDSLGYVVSNNQSGYSLLVVPDYNVIVVEKDKKYDLVTTLGKEIYGFFPFDSVYISIQNGKTSYLMSWNSQTIDATVQLDGLGYGKNSTKKQSDTTSEDTTDTTEENQEEMTEEQQVNEGENVDNNNDNNESVENNENQ